MTLPPPYPDTPVDTVLRNRVAKLGKAHAAPERDSPFIVADLSKTLRQHQRWMHFLPQIQPFYAVKCNPDAHLLNFLANMGLGFDCASAAEIQLVLDLGVDPSRIIFSHPCKAASALQMASSRGVHLTVFDNLDELEKISEVSRGMSLLLRIYAQDDTARVCLGKKFGAPLHTTQLLLLKARDLGLNVVGVSFHIGSAASDPKAFTTAVRHARRVFDQGKDMGFDMDILDVGGGFQDSNFDLMSLSLRLATEQEFPTYVRIISEPGRFYARSFYTLACKIISRRKHISAAAIPPEADMLYQNDGVYGCFMGKLTEEGEFTPTLIPVDKDHSIPRIREKHSYSIWGPTCDSVDCVVDRATLECEALVGDWLMYRNMGAYSVASATTFNGFPNTYEIFYVSSRLLAEGETRVEE